MNSHVATLGTGALSVAVYITLTGIPISKEEPGGKFTARETGPLIASVTTGSNQNTMEEPTSVCRGETTMSSGQLVKTGGPVSAGTIFKKDLHNLTLAAKFNSR